MPPEHKVHSLEDSSARPARHDPYAAAWKRRSPAGFWWSMTTIWCARVLTALLRSAEFEVEAASNGEDALRVMESRHCQVLLTDWQMPDMDGLSLCRIVRSENAESYVYVLMLTVRDSKEDLLKGLGAGADDYVVKSAPIEEILARMEVARRITHIEYSLRRSNRENRRLAVTDALTGAHNLRYLVKHLPRELSRSQRYLHPLAVSELRYRSLQADQRRPWPRRRRRGAACVRGSGDAAACARAATGWRASAATNSWWSAGNRRGGRQPRRAQAAKGLFPLSRGDACGTGEAHRQHRHYRRRGGSGNPRSSKIEELLRAADRGLYASKRNGGNIATSTSIVAGKVASIKHKGDKNGIN
jgi:DNA-binding response OmpR family regulator